MFITTKQIYIAIKFSIFIFLLNKLYLLSLLLEIRDNKYNDFLHLILININKYSKFVSSLKYTRESVGKITK